MALGYPKGIKLPGTSSESRGVPRSRALDYTRGIRANLGPYILSSVFMVTQPGTKAGHISNSDEISFTQVVYPPPKTKAYKTPSYHFNQGNQWVQSPSPATVWDWPVDVKISSTMKLYLGIAIVAAGFIYTVAGIICNSDCAACWKDNDSDGTDIKFSCRYRNCGWACPEGYSRIHCARAERCQ